MAFPTLTLDGLNLNDGTVYTLMSGMELGARQKTWDELRSYTGAVTQANVSEAYYIPAHCGIRVQGSSAADLDVKVKAINTKIDGFTAAAGKSFVYDGTTYVCGASARVAYALGARELLKFWTVVDLVMNRVP